MTTKYPIPSVAAVVVSREGRVWLQRDGEKYRLPERPLEGGDDWRRSAHKIVAEAFLETGPEKLVGLYSNPKLHLVGEGESRRHYLVSAFRFDAVVITADTEWFPGEALPISLPPADRQIIADALRGGDVVTR